MRPVMGERAALPTNFFIDFLQHWQRTRPGASFVVVCAVMVVGSFGHFGRIENVDVINLLPLIWYCQHQLHRHFSLCDSLQLYLMLGYCSTNLC